MFYEFKAIAVLIYRKIGSPNLKTIPNNPMDSNEKKNAENERVTEIRDGILKDAFGIFINGVSKSATSRMKEYVDGSETLNDYFLELQILYNTKSKCSISG